MYVRCQIIVLNLSFSTWLVLKLTKINIWYILDYPQNIIRKIPKIVQDRISILSSSEDIFRDNIGPYQKTIEDAESRTNWSSIRRSIAEYVKSQKPQDHVWSHGTIPLGTYKCWKILEKSIKPSEKAFSKRKLLAPNF